MADYILINETDNFVLIEDQDNGRSVTNDAGNVVNELDTTLAGGLRQRRLYYRDTSGRYDELRHAEGQFQCFAPCTENQQVFLSGINESN